MPPKNGKCLSAGFFNRLLSSSERPITLLADAMSSVSFDFLVLGGDFNLPDPTWEINTVEVSRFPYVYDL